MRRLFTYYSAAIAVFLILSFSMPPGNEQVKADPNAAGEVVESINRFGMNLLQSISREDNSGNIFISPYSIATVLAAVLNGAEGRTRDEIVSALQFEGFSESEIKKGFRTLNDSLAHVDTSVVLSIANSIWFERRLPVKREFKKMSRNIFDAEVIEVGFDNLPIDKINDWVRDKTEGKIPVILEGPLDPNVVMILINAIYFNGEWKDIFDESQTYHSFFIRSDSSRISCKMMLRYGSYRYLENDEFQMIELPYLGEAHSMIIVLPAQEMALDSLIGSATNESLNQWQAEMKYLKGWISLPKFDLEYTAELSTYLMDLGINTAFEEWAEFDRISRYHPLFIGSVKHKTIINVNEKGTEAAAATSELMTIGILPEEFRMRVDRPFLLIIRENKTNAILFIGKIVDLES